MRRNLESMTLRVQELAPLLEPLSMDISAGFISIGGNRNPAAADWDVDGQRILAFGADNGIALWDPLVGKRGTHSNAHC